LVEVYSSYTYFYSVRIDSPPNMQQPCIALSKNDDALRVIWGPFQASCPFEPVLDQPIIKLLNLMSSPKRLQVTSERGMIWKRLAYIHINYHGIYIQSPPKGRSHLNSCGLVISPWIMSSMWIAHFNRHSVYLNSIPKSAFKLHLGMPEN